MKKKTLNKSPVTVPLMNWNFYASLLFWMSKHFFKTTITVVDE